MNNIADDHAPITPQRLRAIRRALGLTQAALGAMLDRSERSIRDYETGAAEIDRCLDLAIRWLREHPPAS